ncbi:MAG: RtcB family protein [Deltaproteobacteria bacterium]|nr:RtcB family protein [Deltaproteobacteria bacterium]MBW2303659.1 RtcB family protein [Deltaproteobacteria bacterium]
MQIKLEQLDDNRWLIPKAGKMRVPGLIFSSKALIKDIEKDQSLVQVTNVATLPGIRGYSLAMPDIHWGYGFPIGGVAAFDVDEGIISPGGVGYDINCGCRLMTTSLIANEIMPNLRKLLSDLFIAVPAGVGSTGVVHLSKKEETEVALEGAAWAVKQGFGRPEDLERTEDHGTLEGADPSVLSDRAMKRGIDQLGTLGSGNHFLEIQVVDKVYDLQIARAFRIFEGQVTVLIHSGSRGFGHQICDDFLKEMGRQLPSQKIDLPDRQLACALLRSDLGRRYLSAMACAANYAWANRQILMHLVYETFIRSLSIGPKELGMELLYDVCHNIAKIERHTYKGREVSLCVHRKGATRSLPPGHPGIPPLYRQAGQPVLIPGDMGTYSFILAGAPGAMEKSFGSSCHGAGRVMSRSQAVKTAKGRAIHRELEDRGILVQSKGKRTMKEEIPEAYKDVSQVVEVVHQAGLAKKVARLKPLAVIKG